MTLVFLKELYVHMEWADALVWQAALSTGDGAPDPQLHDVLVHLHSTQWAFLEAWGGGSVKWSEVDALSALSEVQTWARTYYGPVRDFLSGLSEADLDRPLQLPWANRVGERTGRKVATTALSDTLFQVPAHSTYHRGQVNRRIRELGGIPPLVDYIVWAWFGKPAAVWSG